MKTQVKPKIEFEVAKEYEWRDRFGVFHKPRDMETRHLFHVIRMIWDHSMPSQWQTKWLRRYVFPKYYTVEYMAASVRIILPELLNRKDLTEEQWFWLQFMRQHLLDKQLQIPFILQIDYRE